jgi:hypothetical protein
VAHKFLVIKWYPINLDVQDRDLHYMEVSAPGIGRGLIPAFDQYEDAVANYPHENIISIHIPKESAI